MRVCGVEDEMYSKHDWTAKARAVAHPASCASYGSVTSMPVAGFHGFHVSRVQQRPDNEQNGGCRHNDPKSS